MDQESVLRGIALSHVQGQLAEVMRQAAAMQCHRELLHWTLEGQSECEHLAQLDADHLGRCAVRLSDGLVRALGLIR